MFTYPYFIHDISFFLTLYFRCDLASETPIREPTSDTLIIPDQANLRCLCYGCHGSGLKIYIFCIGLPASERLSFTGPGRSSQRPDQAQALTIVHGIRLFEPAHALLRPLLRL